MSSRAKTVLAIVGLVSLVWFLAHRRGSVKGTRSTATENAKESLANGFGLFGRGADETAESLANISGRVRSKAREPLAGAMACVFFADREPTQSDSEPVCEPPDASGRYVLQHLRMGDYQLSVTANGHQPRIVNRGEPIHLRGKDVVLPDTELDVGGALVSGTVSDAMG
jgi:hypothetical protein